MATNRRRRWEDFVADAHGDGDVDGAVNDGPETETLLLQQVEANRMRVGGKQERMGIRKCVPADALYIL